MTGITGGLGLGVWEMSLLTSVVLNLSHFCAGLHCYRSLSLWLFRWCYRASLSGWRDHPATLFPRIIHIDLIPININRIFEFIPLGNPLTPLHPQRLPTAT
jgi:hypothetical protein